LIILLAAGILSLLSIMVREKSKFLPVAALSIPPVGFFLSPTLGNLFWYFLKTGSVLFGSGYVLLAFLQTDLVDHWHWLTQAQLLDTIAVGQATPGPVFTAATFIGYLLAGLPGAVLATLGIFLPAFLLVALSGWLVPWARRSRWVGAFLDGVNVGSMALMAWVACELVHTSVTDVSAGILFVLALIGLFRTTINPAWWVGIGALTGALLSAFH